MGVLIKNEFYKLKREWFMVFLLLLSLLPIITGGAGAIFNSSTTSLADLFFFMNNQFSMFFPMVLFILIGSLFYQEYKNKTIFKDSFYNSHKKEIDRYQRARDTIEKFTGTSVIKLNDWQKEISSLENQIQELTKDKAKVQDEFKQIDHIKYAVKIVNDEYGIDLSIEIDKAIKRGDKPSVIAQLKKFQEQEERKEQYKQKAKEKAKENYKNKGEER